MARILVLDGDDGIRETLSILFHDNGYTVLAVAHVEEVEVALRMCADRLVVLFDAGIPGMRDGQVNLMASLDEPLLCRHAYICMTTDMPWMKEIDPRLLAALSARSIPIIRKPFDLNHLLGMVRQAEAALSLPLQPPPGKWYCAAAMR